MEAFESGRGGGAVLVVVAVVDALKDGTGFAAL